MTILLRLPIIWELEFELEILNLEIKIFVFKGLCYGFFLRVRVKGSGMCLIETYIMVSVLKRLNPKFIFLLKHPNHVIRKL